MTKEQIQSKIIVFVAVVLSIAVLLPLRGVSAATVAWYMICFSCVFSGLIYLMIKK